MRKGRLRRAVTVGILLLAAAGWRISTAGAAGDFESLVAAIEAANSGGSGTIALSGDITLGARLLPVTGSLTIDGGGYSISGDGVYRIFDVDGGALRLSNITLTAGTAPERQFGGALRLRNGARVSIDGAAFSDNRAVQGGAIATHGAGVDLSISNSTFARNHAGDYGGALFLEGGTTKVTRSSFQENKSDWYGGAIAAHDGRLNVANSTFSDNSADFGGVIEVFLDEVTFTHVTMINNRARGRSGGAIHRTAGVIHLYNSIVDGNATFKACTNGLNHASGNISHDGSCNLLGARAEALVGEMTGAPGWFPLLDGSPALDAADPAYCLETDQNGTPRPQGGGCDAGAIESTTAQLAPTPILPPPGCPLYDAIVAANTDAPSGACLGGQGHDTISLDADEDITQPLPPITSEITIEGNGFSIDGKRQNRIFDIAGGELALRNVRLINGKATSAGGAIRLRENARLTADGVEFTRNTAEQGGAIATTAASASASIRNSRFELNKADIYGGAVLAQRGTVNVSQSSFLRNSAGGSGGALQIGYGVIDVANSTFHRNSAASGGAVTIDFGGITLTHVTMVDDFAMQNNGDAIKNGDGSAVLRNSIITSDQVADDCAGRIEISRGVISPDGSCGLKTSADARLGDAVRSPLYFPLLDGSPAVDAAIAEFCPATDQVGQARPLGNGCDIGAIESESAAPPDPTPAPTACTLADRILAANTDRPAGLCPAGRGADTIRLTEDITLAERLPPITRALTIEGAGFSISGDERFPIFTVDGAPLTINNLTLVDGRNPRSGGGAVSLLGGASVVVRDSSFLRNQAKGGGAIALRGRNSQLVVFDSSFVENSAESGGAIEMWSDKLTIRGSSFVDNKAEFSGGAIDIASGESASITNSTFSGNAADYRGGALSVGWTKVTMTHVTMVGNRAPRLKTEDRGHALLIYDRNSGFNLRNSIIAGVEDGPACVGPLTQNIGNLIEDGTCSPALSGDPMLDALTGSPPFHAPLPGSAAINAADARFCREVDQIGTKRSLVGACDIGAIESIPVIVDLSGCNVTTTHGLNFRDGPAGTRIGLVAESATLAATARTPGWFQVEYNGVTGWISADYVVTEGECG